VKGAVRSRELVVLLDDEGRAVGTAPKAQVHGQDTPLHLAFSCYVFDVNGELLITRRALAKATWPGVWTNSFCGHPGPGEDLFDAVHRRAEQELGLLLDDLQLTLPSFRYTAVMDNGVRENELCPVFTAVTATPVAADPDEVEATDWVPWDVFRDEVTAGERDVSPWCAMQVEQLGGRENGRGGFHPAEVDDLPPAARSFES
jgi:isopentenyl-diphosphate delta-isomerase